MINDWYQNRFKESNLDDPEITHKNFFLDITDKEETLYNNPKPKNYQVYHGRYLYYINNPENMKGYSKLLPEYKNEILAFDGRAIDEIAYMESIFEFEFYWHPRLNLGIMCNKGGFFHDYVYDRFDYEDILYYRSAIESFFEEGKMPPYSENLIKNEESGSST